MLQTTHSCVEIRHKWMFLFLLNFLMKFIKWAIRELFVYIYIPGFDARIIAICWCSFVPFFILFNEPVLSPGFRIHVFFGRSVRWLSCFIHWFGVRFSAVQRNLCFKYVRILFSRSFLSLNFMAMTRVILLDITGLHLNTLPLAYLLFCLFLSPAPSNWLIKMIENTLNCIRNML